MHVFGNLRTRERQFRIRARRYVPCSRDAVERRRYAQVQHNGFRRAAAVIRHRRGVPPRTVYGGVVSRSSHRSAFRIGRGKAQRVSRELGRLVFLALHE